ncbi:electron transport complex subunit RnfG [Clostridium acetireducens DSM 10703]|jgi:electron transport complex protein RnfG|uniref:Ion-translocating oxidoreductase complex subunit G n=1 Tax=Clostridium acetireducens DSM 10703 TaxID=1121290 RepID=A0A1E8EYR2_9CLOT|nr:RnfABCDGE type electron transport complex subunit G [Clostridium acetireducens]OFI05829.1 electron transport complex subunit RnfG [Clostridium acetireducens DSM 10703]
MKENSKLGLILLAITAVTAFLIAQAYLVTKEPIEQQAIVTNNEAMKEILPQAAEFKKEDVTFPDTSIVQEINKGVSGDKVEGYCIKVKPKGYGGKIEIVVGISTEDKVTGIKILSHSETPGLGANSEDPKFYGQYKDKPATELSVVKGTASKDTEISAITGATITSKGVTSGVNEAIKYYETKLKGGNK